MNKVKLGIGLVVALILILIGVYVYNNNKSSADMFKRPIIGTSVPKPRRENIEYTEKIPVSDSDWVAYKINNPIITIPTVVPPRTTIPVPSFELGSVSINNVTVNVGKSAEIATTIRDKNNKIIIGAPVMVMWSSDGSGYYSINSPTLNQLHVMVKGVKKGKGIITVQVEHNGVEKTASATINVR